MIQIQRILVPTDFSDPSWRAAEYACELAKRFDAQLDLLHVIVPPVVAMPSPGAPLPEQVLLDTEESVKGELEQWHAAELAELPNVTRDVIQGTPFAEIVRHVREHQIDLIVMGTHGRTGLSHLLIGSVAERVVRKAQCPVLTVRPEGHQFVMP